jgi:hypothetical protein
MAVAAGSRKPASMRACARVALVLMAVSASFGLAACGAIDDPRDAVSRWFDVGKPPGGPGGFFADHLPNATPMIPPKKSLKNEASKASKTSKTSKKDKPASKVQRPQTAEQKLPTSHTIEAPKPQDAEPQSVRHLPTPASRGLATGVHGDGLADENALRTFQGKSVTFSTDPSGVISGTEFGSNYQFSPNWLSGAEDELSRPRFRKPVR